MGASHKTKAIDYALESIHNMKEALPELWEDVKPDVRISEKTAIEVRV